MTVIEAFEKKIKETYALKKYMANIADVKLLHDIPGVKFSTGHLSFFQSLNAIVEPLQKMGVVNAKPQKQLTPFNVGRTTIVDSHQQIVLYKNGENVFVKHAGKDDGKELKNSNNWIFDDGVNELQISPASIYTLMMQLGLDFCKTLKDDHFKKLKNNKKFLPRLYEAVYGKLMTSGEKTGHKKQTPNYVVKFIRRGASGNTIIQSTKDYMGKENKEPYVNDSPKGKARFYLCKGNIKFPIQYRWKGGAMMDNLSFHVEMPLDIDQADTRGENGDSGEDEI